MGKENARQAGQWAANGNNKKQIKMPGNNFCQRVSLSLHCGQPATKMRIICASTTWGLPKDCCRLQGEGGRGVVDCLASRVSIRGMQPRTMLDTKLQIMQFVRTSIANCECNQHKLFDLWSVEVQYCIRVCISVCVQFVLIFQIIQSLTRQKY